jgi:hypothetical protein
MSTAAVRAALVSMIAGIADIGQVYGFERFAGNNADFQALYLQADKTVRGWFVQRVAERRAGVASGRVLVTTRWLITGYVSLVDASASAVTADTLADAIIAAEGADPTLGGVARGLPIEGAAGVQLAESDTVMFAGVLCHRLRLALDVQSFEGEPAGGLGDVDGAAGRLIGAIVDRLKATVASSFGAIEGRLGFDAEDDPAAFPAAIVVPLGDVSDFARTTIQFRTRIDRAVGIVITAPSGYPPGDGALAAGGLEALRETVRTALHGWGDAAGVVDIPLLFAGGEPVPAAAGRIAWRDRYSPSIFIEA